MKHQKVKLIFCVIIIQVISGFWLSGSIGEAAIVKTNDIVVELLPDPKQKNHISTPANQINPQKDISKMPSVLPKTGDNDLDKSLMLGGVILGISILLVALIKKREGRTIKMKKNNVMLVVMSAGAIFTFGGAAVQADTLEGNTEANVEVKAGALDLILDRAISFDAITLNGEDQLVNENKSSKVQISDLRGSSTEGWNLTVKKQDPAENGFGSKANKGIDLVLNPYTTASYASVSDKMVVNDQPQPVAWVSDSQIAQSELKTAVDLKSQLDISKKARAKTYSTSLVWNVKVGP